jgi:heme exporter protein B
MSLRRVSFVGLVRKDLRLLSRRPGPLVGLVATAAIVLLLMSFGGSPSPEALRERGAAALWLGLFLGAAVFLGDSFDAERSDGAQRMMLVMGADAAGLYYAKAVVNALALFLAGLALTPFMVALFGAEPQPLGYLAVLALGALALSAPGTLFAALVADSDRRGSLLPIILLPLVVPVIIGATRATSLLVYGDPMGQRPAWFALLGVFALLHWTLDGLLYGKAVD